MVFYNKLQEVNIQTTKVLVILVEMDFEIWILYWAFESHNM